MVPRFALPRTRTGWEPWFLVSAAIHAVLIGLLVLLPEPPSRAPVIAIVLEPSEGLPEVPALVFTGPGGAGRPPGDPGETPERRTGRILIAEAPAPVPQPPIEAPVRVDSVPVGLAVGPTGPGASEVDEGVVGTHRRLGPAYGNGLLWVPPAEVPYRGEAPFDPAVHAARIDSALVARLLAYIDTMPADSFATEGVPKWTKEIGGKDWGVDGSWIYLGDIKIPSAILALLPFPSGNYDQALQAERLAQIRADIVQAARRAQNASDFKRYVKEIRERKDAERDERGAAPPLPPPRDTLIP